MLTQSYVGTIRLTLFIFRLNISILSGSKISLPGKEMFKYLKNMSNVKVFLNHWIAQNAKNPKECATMMTDGYNACFRLSHRGVVGVDSMTVTLKDGSVKDIEGDDELRLWLSLRCIQGDNKKVGESATISFFAGVTSACMKPKDDVGSVRTDTKQGNPTAWEILPFDEDDTYNAQNYGGSEQSKSLYQDIGNMTTSDYRLYEQSMLNSISNEAV